MKRKNLFTGYIYVILSALIFGLMPLMAKFIYADGVNPPTLVFLRNAFAVPVLALISFMSGNKKLPEKKLFSKITFTALMGCCITPMLLFSSYNYIPSGSATVFHFVYPAVVVIGEFLLLKNKVKVGHITSIILCVGGIAMFYNPDAGINFEGSFYALLSGVTYAVYIICLSSLSNKNIPTFTFSMYITLIAGISTFAICAFSDSLSFPHSVSGWILSVFFALSLNVGAVVLFQKGTFMIGGGRSSVLSAFEPITGVIAGILIFNEKINAFTFVGTVLVIAACVLIALCDICDKTAEK